MNNPYTLTPDFLHKKLYRPDGSCAVESTQLNSNFGKIAAMVLFMLAEEEVNKEKK